MSVPKSKKIHKLSLGMCLRAAPVTSMSVRIMAPGVLTATQHAYNSAAQLLPPWREIIQPLADQVEGLTALPVKVLAKSSSATITLQEGSKLLSDSTVGVYATAAADASGSASSNLVSIGYTRAEGTAIVDIQRDVEIVSVDKSVVVTASGGATASIGSSTARELSSTPNPGGGSTQFALAAAVSDANVTSHVSVAQGASISAGNWQSESSTSASIRFRWVMPAGKTWPHS